MTITRDELLAHRATGIGGSDAQHLFDLPPYGCRRRLVYDKRGTPEDFPFTGNADTERGTRLEPIVAELYAEQTGTTVVDWPFARHPEEPHLIVHVDRCIIDPDTPDSFGALEIKCPRVRGFLKVKREGLPEAYILQLQHALMVTGWTWGAFAVFSAELWELVHFRVERDETLIMQLRLAAGRLWKQVTEGPMPDRLPPGEPQCRECPWRHQCQGAALLESVPESDGDFPADESVEPLVRDYLDAQTLASEADELKEAAKERLQDAVGQRPGVVCSLAKVTYRPYERETLDVAGIRKHLPDVAASYTRRSAVRPLYVKPLKG